MKPTELIWLANGVIKRLNQHKPTRGGTAEEADDPGEAQNAFIGLFGNVEYIWINRYQLFQSVKYLGGVNRFTGRISGYQIVCGCGMNHKEQKNRSN